LQSAAELGDLESAIMLLDHGADVNGRNDGQETPLHYAMKGSPLSLDMVKLLVDRGADVNAQDYRGETPLHFAVMAGGPMRLRASILSLEMIELLLDRGADVNARDWTGKTPVFYAALSDEPNKDVIVEFLLKHGADPNLPDEPLGDRAQRHQSERIKKLLEQKYRERKSQAP